MACPYTCPSDEYCDMSCVDFICENCIYFDVCDYSDEGVPCEDFEVI